MHYGELYDLAHGGNFLPRPRGALDPFKSENFCEHKSPFLHAFLAGTAGDLCKNTVSAREVEKSSKIRGNRHTAHCIKTHTRAISGVHFSTPAVPAGSDPRERIFQQRRYQCCMTDPSGDNNVNADDNYA